MYPFPPGTCTYILTLPNPGLPNSSTPISSLRIPGSSGWYYNEILIVGDMIEWDILPLQLNPLLWVADSWHAVPVRNPQQQSWEKAPSEISSRLLFGKPALRNWLLLTTARNDRWPTNPATRVWWFLVPSRHCREEETVYQITTFIYWLSGVLCEYRCGNPSGYQYSVYHQRTCYCSQSQSCIYIEELEIDSGKGKWLGMLHCYSTCLIELVCPITRFPGRSASLGLSDEGCCVLNCSYYNNTRLSQGTGWCSFT